MAAVKNDGLALKHIPEYLKTESLCRIAATSNPEARRFLPMHKVSDKESMDVFTRKMLEQLPDPAIQGYGWCLPHKRRDLSDRKYNEAVAIVLKNKDASISMIQRQLRIGYSCAVNLLEQMERDGLVSPMDCSGRRKVLVPSPETNQSST